MPERVNITNDNYVSDSVSVTLTWSSSAGADSYTVVVLPQATVNRSSVHCEH